jgi:hypothetical protein
MASWLLNSIICGPIQGFFLRLRMNRFQPYGQNYSLRSYLHSEPLA